MLAPGDGVNMSVLPGCALAIPFTRAYLKAEMTAVENACDLADQTVYVDDVGHHAVGRAHRVVDAIVEAGGAFVRATYGSVAPYFLS